MGQDKALLPWRGTTLLEHATSRLRAVCAEVRILCGPEPRYLGHGLEVVLDRARDAGPLAGLAAALESCGEAGALLLAVDLPGVPVDLLAELMRLAPEQDVVVPVTSDGPQPLCACYGPGCRGALQSSLTAGAHRMTGFWAGLRVRQLEDAELRRFGDPRRLFLNVNTPQDYAALPD